MIITILKAIILGEIVIGLACGLIGLTIGEIIDSKRKNNKK